MLRNLLVHIVHISLFNGYGPGLAFFSLSLTPGTSDRNCRKYRLDHCQRNLKKRYESFRKELNPIKNTYLNPIFALRLFRPRVRPWQSWLRDRGGNDPTVTPGGVQAALVHVHCYHYSLQSSSSLLSLASMKIWEKLVDKQPPQPLSYLKMVRLQLGESYRESNFPLLPRRFNKKVCE